MHQPQEGSIYILPCSCELFSSNFEEFEQNICPHIMQHYRKFPDTEVEIAEAGVQNYVDTLQTHLQITRKEEMDSVKYSNSSKPTQAISNWRNGKWSSVNYQLFWCLNSWHR